MLNWFLSLDKFQRPVYAVSRTFSFLLLFIRLNDIARCQGFRKIMRSDNISSSLLPPFPNLTLFPNPHQNRPPSKLFLPLLNQSLKQSAHTSHLWCTITIICHQPSPCITSTHRVRAHNFVFSCRTMM